MKDAIYGEGNNLSMNLNRFNEQITGYDKNRNILGLKRFGQTSQNDYGLIDDLSLSYNGNRLLSVKENAANSAYAGSFEFSNGADKSVEYSYDISGNLKRDLNKKITDIQYNYLNLPSLIKFENGSNISYLYSPEGAKLRTTHVTDKDTLITDYCGNVIYENGIPVKLLTEVGYVTLADAVHHYFLQDHQGNNRVVIDENNNVDEVNHYYPFGGVFASTSSVQPFKYNSKELDRKNGLDWYDYGARMYDAAKGSWDRMDKLAEKYKATTPYAYSINNPSKFADIDGLDIVYMLQGGIEQKRIISKQNITYVQNLANQGKESFSKEDSLFLQTFIIHKTNMPTKLLFDRQIYKIAKNTNNENFLNKRNTKINISERIINNQKVYIYELRYKKIPPLEQECIYILFFPNTHECYIFYFQKLLIKENNIWLWFNLRGNLSVTRINLEELKTIIL